MTALARWRSGEAREAALDVARKAYTVVATPASRLLCRPELAWVDVELLKAPQSVRRG